MRAVVGRATKLTVLIADYEGDATVADNNTVTVDIVDGSGAAVVTGAAATADTPAGNYHYVLAPQTQLDTYSITWHATVGGFAQTISDTLRICGNRILSPGDLAADTVLAALDARTRAEVLDGVEDLFSDALGFPPVLEGIRVNFDAHRGTVTEAGQFGNLGGALSVNPGMGFGGGGERLLIPGINRPHQVLALNLNGAAVDSGVLAQFKAGPGYLIWSGGNSWPTGNYDMWLSHGLPFVPGDLRWAAATFARYAARRTSVSGKVNSLLPERTASVTTEGATIVFSMVSPERPTGIPDVDGVLTRYAVSSVI